MSLRDAFQPSSAANFKAFGNWADAVRKLGQLDGNIKEACLKAQHTVSKKILKIVKGHLIKQDLGWTPLSKRYAKAKKRKGLDNRTLISRKTYHNNISSWNNKGGWNVFIGVKKGIFNRNLNGKKNKMDIATIATYHEFSRKKGKKRPLWNPSIRELGTATGIKKLYIDEIEKNLRRKGYGFLLRRIRKI